MPDNSARDTPTTEASVVDLDFDPRRFYRSLYTDRLNYVKGLIAAGEPPFHDDWQHPTLNLTERQPNAVNEATLLEELKNARVIVVSQFQALPECRQELAKLITAFKNRYEELPIALALDHFDHHGQVHLKSLRADGNLSTFEAITQVMQRLGPRYFQSLQPLLKLGIGRGLTPAETATCELLAADDLKGSTKERDQAMVEVVRSWLQANAQGICFVLVGEGRLADGSLYQACHELAATQGSDQAALLLQAWEPAFWQQLDDHTLNDKQLLANWQEPYLRWDQHLFSINPVPPLVKLDSFITQREGHEGWPGYPIYPAAQEMRRAIRSTLDLPFTSDSEINVWVDPDVYCCADLELLFKIKQGQFSKEENEALKEQMLTFNSYYLPQQHVIYLASLNGYHVGEEIGHSVRVGYTNEWGDKAPAFTAWGWLFYHTINEAAGYLCSKIISPGRKPSEGRGRKAFKNLHRLFQKRSSYKGKNIDKAEIRRLSHLAGYGLGELLYQRLQFQEIEAEELHLLFRKEVHNEKEAMQLFEEAYALAEPSRHLVDSALKKSGIAGQTIKERLHFVAGFYLLAFFLPAVLWHDLSPNGRFQFPQPINANWQNDLYLILASVGGVVLISELLTRFVKPLRELSGALKRLLGKLSIGEVFLLAAFSGICEELLFRGALQPSLGIVATSLLFGFIHFVPDRRFYPWTVFATLVGFLLGFLYEISGNLLVPIVTHGLINFINILRIMQRKA